MKQFSVHSEIGMLGEALAKRYLEGLGYRVKACNYYYEKGKRSGEIDIIASFHKVLHFIEVKTRAVDSSEKKSRALYFPIESQVTPLKMRKCVKTAQHYLWENKQEDVEHHFDLVTVLYFTKEKKAEIQYLKDIFYY